MFDDEEIKKKKKFRNTNDSYNYIKIIKNLNEF